MLMRALTMEPFMGATTMHPCITSQPAKAPAAPRTNERTADDHAASQTRQVDGADMRSMPHRVRLEDRFAQSNGDDAEAGAPAAGVENTMMNAICKRTRTA